MLKKYRGFLHNEGKSTLAGETALQNFDKHFDWRLTRRTREVKRQAVLQVDPAPGGSPGEAEATVKCSICLDQCLITHNPWERTRSDLTQPKDPLAEPVAYGIELKPCRHCFCGVCLAQTIYTCINIVFDPTLYGTTLESYVPATPGLGATTFPISCPECQIELRETAVKIESTVAQLVLGESNMGEWNHAQYLSTLNIIFCPSTACSAAFPADVTLSREQVYIQCPGCSRLLCSSCKSVWHQNMTCQMYQATIRERAPEDAQLIDLAKQKRWQQCPKCSAIVELKYGCNHIICRCKHHFCYRCRADFEYMGGRYRCKGGCAVWEELL